MEYLFDQEIYAYMPIRRKKIVNHHAMFRNYRMASIYFPEIVRSTMLEF